MLRTRILVSVVLVPAFVGLCWLDSRTGTYAAILMPLAVLLAVQACRETAALLRLGRGSTIATTIGSLAVLVTLWAWHLAQPDSTPQSRDGQGAMSAASITEPPPGAVTSLDALGPALLAYAIVVLALLALRMAVFLGPGGHAATVGAEVFTVSYVGLLLATAAELRWTGDDGRLGYLALGSLVIGAKVGDIGGYSFGRLFGKTKLAPILSPGKTRAGAVGAILTAAVVTALWLRYAGRLFDPNAAIASWPHLLLFGTVLGVVGLVGDLCESLLKRDAGMKDASALMPAFGGLLDLIDSILYSAPVALFLWTVWPPVS